MNRGFSPRAQATRPEPGHRQTREGPDFSRATKPQSISRLQPLGDACVGRTLLSAALAFDFVAHVQSKAHEVNVPYTVQSIGGK